MELSDRMVPQFLDKGVMRELKPRIEPRIGQSEIEVTDGSEMAIVVTASVVTS